MIVETGEGLPNADSYVSVADATTYFQSRGLTGWVTSPTAPAEQALVRATAYIDGRYRKQFPGRRLNGRDQALEWPRERAYDQAGEEIDDDSVPREVKDATCEAALREFTTPGSLNPDVVPAERVIRERVDVIDVTYADPGTASAMVPVVGRIEDILSGLLVGGTTGTTTASFFARA